VDSGSTIGGSNPSFPAKIYMLKKSLLPQVLFLDWDGTLCTSRFWHHWINDDPENYDKIQTEFFARDDGMLDSWMRGNLTAEAVVNKISIRTAIDYGYLIKGLEISCKTMTFGHTESLDIIKQKRSQGIKVVIATDNMDTFMRWTVPSMHLQDHFDDILCSYELGALKTDFSSEGISLFFDRYLQRNNLDPNDAILIDDRDKNIIKNKIKMDFIQVSESLNIVDVLKSI
jgi:FMN phosphatase YigB (HAD superfamily)